LQAWKHAVVYLEEYMEAVEKIHKTQAKEYEKVLKVHSVYLHALARPY
jgi:preprotein translocase subunit Sss1